MQTPKDFSLLFAYPPGSYVDMPALGIPCLQGYLKEKGYSNISVWESNIGFLEFLLDPENIAMQGDRIRSGEAARKDDAWRKRSRFLLPYVREEIGTALETFRDPQKYYDVQAFNRSTALVQRALEIYSSENDPVDFTFNYNGFYIQTDPNVVTRSLRSVLDFVHSGEHRLFRQFFEKELLRLRPTTPYDLIGFSCPNPHQLFPTLLLAKWMREAGLGKKFVLGGSFVTSSRKVLGASQEIFDLFDYLITFEGEVALGSLADALRTGGDVSSVPNLHYREKRELRQNAPAKIENLDLLPTPDFSGFPLEKYWTPEPVLPAYSTRGCFYDICTFCNHHENYFGAFRGRTTETVLKDLQAFKDRYGATKIFFVDELMVPRQQVEIAEGIIRKGLGTKWYAHARVAKQLTKERLSVMAKGGLTLLHVGMESASTPVLDLMKKGYDSATVHQFLGDLRETPLTIHLNTINGFPGEQPENYIETLEVAWEFAKAGDYVHLYGFDLIQEAPLSKGGNPFVASASVKDEDLDVTMSYVLQDVRDPSPSQIETIGKLRLRLMGSLQHLNELFPNEFCWAAHLLYVSHYRETGRGELLDTPLKDFGVYSKKFMHFIEKEKLPEKIAILSPESVISKIPMDGSEKWALFDPCSFSLTVLPDPLGKTLSEGPAQKWTLRELEFRTGTTLKELLPTLYELAKAGAMTLENRR